MFNILNVTLSNYIMLRISDDFVKDTQLYYDYFKHDKLTIDTSANKQYFLICHVGDIKDYIDAPMDVISIIIKYANNVIFLNGSFRYISGRNITDTDINKLLDFDIISLTIHQSTQFNNKSEYKLTHHAYDILSIKMCISSWKEMITTILVISFNKQLIKNLNVKKELIRTFKKYKFENKYEINNNTFRFERKGHYRINYEYPESTLHTNIFQIIIFLYNLVIDKLNEKN